MAMANPVDVNHLQVALALNRKIVGVKLFACRKDYQLFPVASSKHRLSYCMAVNLAAAGHSLKVEEKHFKCEGAKRIFGFTGMSDDVRSGRHHARLGLYGSLQTAKAAAEDIAFIDHKIHGIALFPLEDIYDQADVVILICDPYNAMRIIQGYAYHRGMPPDVGLIGNQAFCSELTVRPMIKNDINISLLCSGTRFYCKWKDHELGIGMPSFLFPAIVDGILKTLNPTEPDRKKRTISDRAKRHELGVDLKMGTNYFKSKTGVEKLKAHNEMKPEDAV